jgi:hypothetical protein
MGIKNGPGIRQDREVRTLKRYFTITIEIFAQVMQCWSQTYEPNKICKAMLKPGNTLLNRPSKGKIK